MPAFVLQNKNLQSHEVSSDLLSHIILKKKCFVYLPTSDVRAFVLLMTITKCDFCVFSCDKTQMPSFVQICRLMNEKIKISLYGALTASIFSVLGLFRNSLRFPNSFNLFNHRCKLWSLLRVLCPSQLCRWVSSYSGKWSKKNSQQNIYNCTV